MLFKLLTLAGALTFTALSFWQIPKIQDRTRNSPQVLAWVKTPDRTYNVIRQCQKQVDNVDRCYNAWSAGVALAEAEDCSAAGLFNKRRFEQLVEHMSDEDIDNEMTKTCPSPRTQS